ncbi:hypothetical protein V1511DRAFT_495594 [Dipodascopsis uninucleata]
MKINSSSSLLKSMNKATYIWSHGAKSGICRQRLKLSNPNAISDNGFISTISSVFFYSRFHRNYTQRFTNLAINYPNFSYRTPYKNHNTFLCFNSIRNMSFGSAAASRLAGKTILITGASSGIGRATAFEFANAANGDVKLILTARREASLIAIKEELEKTYSKAKVFPIVLDVSKLSEIDQFVDSLPEEVKDVDVLVNNAGMVHGVDQVGAIAQSDIDIMFQTNVFGLIALTQKLMPLFKAKGKGDIVNIGSIAGREPYPGGAIYCATKAAVKSFTETLRKELIATRIRVIEIDPGQVETEFSVVRFRGDKDKAEAVYKGVEPLVAEDIAEVIVFAVSRRENTVIADTLVFPSHQASALIMHRKL